MSAWLLVLLALPVVEYAELRAPGTRAVAEGSTGDAAELRLVYRGPTPRTAPLASGELRRQIGLKLRAQDTCNLLYVMWHIAPTLGVHVSLKSNPGLHSHAECTDHGYLTLTPSFQRAPAPLEPGVPRILSARIVGRQLLVSADGLPVWQGTLPEAALALGGPAGLRSDNGQFDVRLVSVRAGVTPVRLRFTAGDPAPPR